MALGSVAPRSGAKLFGDRRNRRRISIQPEHLLSTATLCFSVGNLGELVERGRVARGRRSVVVAVTGPIVAASHRAERFLDGNR